MATTYLLDTNILIEAHQRYYAFDIAPKFWDALKQHADSGRILSIDRVKAELEAGKDELADWACKTCASIFTSTNDPKVIAGFATLMKWAHAQPQYTAAARAEFASVADGWLIAYAVEKKLTIVTHEQYSKDARARVLIPNVCKAFSVPCVNTFEMLRDLGVKLG
jgi:hypothetical protein